MVWHKRLQDDLEPGSVYPDERIINEYSPLVGLEALGVYASLLGTEDFETGLTCAPRIVPGPGDTETTLLKVLETLEEYGLILPTEHGYQIVNYADIERAV